MERIIAGENSYITIAEADDIIAHTYSDDDTVANYWLASEDDDKAGYLLASMNEIEAQPMQGRKYDLYQKLAFPRYGAGNVLYENLVPPEVKKAQAINALGLLDKDLNGTASTGKHLTSFRAERELKAWLNGIFTCV